MRLCATTSSWRQGPNGVRERSHCVNEYLHDGPHSWELQDDGTGAHRFLVEAFINGAPAPAAYVVLAVPGVPEDAAPEDVRIRVTRTA